MIQIELIGNQPVKIPKDYAVFTYAIKPPDAGVKINELILNEPMKQKVINDGDLFAKCFTGNNVVKLILFKSMLDDIANVCISMGNDGTWYGYEYNNFGSANPTSTNDGQLFFAYKWNKDGDFQLKFGDAGDEQIAGVTKISLYNKDYDRGRTAEWVEADKQYFFNDVDLATKLIDKYNLGETDFCIFMGVYQGLVIDYDYDTILMGSPDYRTSIDTHLLTPNSIDVIWVEPNEKGCSYKLERDGTSIYTGSDLHFVDNVSIENDYIYKITVYDSNDTEQFSTAYNFKAVTNYELIHITNNSGSDLRLRIDALQGYSCCGEYKEGYNDLRISNVDIEILYISNTLTQIVFTNYACLYDNENITYDPNEVFKSTELRLVVPVAVPTTSYIDVSHLTKVYQFTLGDPTVTEVPDELKNFNPNVLTNFSFFGCKSLTSLPNMKSIYPLLDGFIHYMSNSDISMPELSDQFDFYEVGNSSTGSYDFTTLSNIKKYFFAYNWNLSATSVDDILEMLVNDGASNMKIDLSNYSCFNPDWENEAPTAAGEDSIDTLRANGCTVIVEGGY